MRTKQTVRAVAFDATGNLILIKRTRPDRAPYWVVPGGGVETDDADLESALRRELWEELHATIDLDRRLLMFERDGITTHLYLVRVREMNPALRTGPEFADSAHGRYDVERVPHRSEIIAALNIQPSEVKACLLGLASTGCDTPS